MLDEYIKHEILRNFDPKMELQTIFEPYLAEFRGKILLF